MTIKPVGVEFESVFERDSLGFVANEVAVNRFYGSFEWHSAFGFVVYVADSRDDFDKEFGDDVFGIVHAYGMGLNYGSVAIDVDDKAWKIVAFAMHKAVGIGVVRLSKTECHAHIVCRFEAFVPERAVDRTVGE